MNTYADIYNGTIATREAKRHAEELRTLAAQELGAEMFRVAIEQAKRANATR